MGKTALEVKLLLANGYFRRYEQVYRQLNIGTARPLLKEQAAAVHHLIDVRDVNEIQPMIL